MAKKRATAAITGMHKSIQHLGTPEMGFTDSGLWQFLHYVFTKDSHEPLAPKKRLPVADKDFLKVVFLYMLACPVLAIPKSRQMMLSWALSAYSVWHAMSGSYRHVVYQTKKEKDGHAMVSFGAKNPTGGRMDFILQHLPDWLRDPNIVAGGGNRVGELVFSPQEVDDSGIPILWQGSIIEAVPQGSEQVRGKTPSLFAADEAAYQDGFSEAVDAIMPAVMGGGQLIAVSSVEAGSHFNNMVLETLDGSDPWDAEKIPPAVATALEMLDMKWPKGMRSWQTPSGVWVLETHYTADSAKDPDRAGQEWFTEAPKAYLGGVKSPGWQREMEINYAASGEMPVFAFLQGQEHKVFIPHITPSYAISKMKLYLGYDYGSTNPAAAIVWGFNSSGHPHALWELYEPCMNLAEHAKKIKECPYWDYLTYKVADPAIMAKTQQTALGMRSIAELFSDHGINFRQGRRGAAGPVAIRFLSDFWADPMNPKAFITSDCPNLRQEVIGLRWKKHATPASELNRDAPEEIKDKNKHAWDASSYLIDTRPGLFIEPMKHLGKDTMGYALDEIDRQLAREEGNRGGIRVC